VRSSKSTLLPGIYRAESIGGGGMTVEIEEQQDLVFSPSFNAATKEYEIDGSVLSPPQLGIRLFALEDQLIQVIAVATNEVSNNFYNPANNAVVKSFESTAGMGLASVVKQLQFTWMSQDIMWGVGEDGPGNRAPRSCKVQMSFEPIHDIAPGLDHEGFNRAPIYPVGSMVNSIVEGGEKEPYGAGTQTMVERRLEIEADKQTYQKAITPGILSRLF
jgi:hypothetical protein